MGQSQRTTAQSVPLDKQRAFALLFRDKTYDAVWSWLRRLGVPRRDRMDLAQDVFLAGYQSFPTYDPLRARPERWLNRITVHVAAHYRDRAHHRREEFTSEDDPCISDDRPSAEEQIDAEETRLLIMDRLKELSAGERAILIEHDLDGIPMQTIAANHGIPLSTAYKWRTRAMEALRALMEEHYRNGKRRRPKLPAASPRRPTRTPPLEARAVRVGARIAGVDEHGAGVDERSAGVNEPAAEAQEPPAQRRTQRSWPPLGTVMSLALSAERGAVLNASGGP